MFAIIRTRWQTRPLSRRAKRRSSPAPGSLRKKYAGIIHPPNMVRLHIHSTTSGDHRKPVLHFSATPQRHLIWFGSPVRIDCRIAGRTLRHEAPAGSLAICPAGIDSAADAEESIDALILSIDPCQVALAPAEVSGLDAQ